MFAAPDAKNLGYPSRFNLDFRSYEALLGASRLTTQHKEKDSENHDPHHHPNPSHSDR
ncbi:hypothetical protein HCH_05678 [Hahella chejuensis KCTC 2396]|uniref:Uncharacterized protein n=1 Tax=Hahella chejuensis (strain KCTC 2396) TaxID=349521 RepID=Q2SAJ1_HAHCH|nr:hypothetical protein HCH_05678 [Hahella chejuensis KCTC 2396]